MLERDPQQDPRRATSADPITSAMPGKQSLTDGLLAPRSATVGWQIDGAAAAMRELRHAIAMSPTSSEAHVIAGPRAAAARAAAPR